MGELAIRRNRGVTAPRYQTVDRLVKQEGGTQKVAETKGFTISETLKELMSRAGQAESQTRESRRTLQKGEAVLAEVQDSLGRMAELARKASGKDAPDRAVLQAELERLAEEIDRMTGSASAGETRLFLDEDPDGMEELLYAALDDVSSQQDGAEALPDWLAKSFVLNGYTPEHLQAALKLGPNAGAAELLAAIADRSLESSSAVAYMASLYLGSVIAGSPGETEAVQGLQQLLHQVAEGVPLDEAIASLTNGSFTGLEDFETQFMEGTAPGLEEFLSGLLSETASEGVFTGSSLLAALIADGDLETALALDLLAGLPDMASLLDLLSPLSDSGPVSIPWAPGDQGTAAMAAGGEAAAVQNSAVQLGTVEVTGQDLSGVSFDESTGELTIAGDANVSIRGTGQEVQAIRLTGSGTVTLQNVRTPLLTVDAAGARLFSAGETVLETVQLREGGVLTLGGGPTRLGLIQAGEGASLRLSAGASVVVEGGPGADGTDGLGSLAVPVVLAGPASLAALASSVSNANGKALEPFDVIWKALLPGWGAITSLAVDGRQAKLALTNQDPARLWLARGDHGSPVHSLLLRGQDANGNPMVRYSCVFWDERARAFQEADPYPNPFTVTGGEEGRDWVYEGESHTLHILTDQVASVSGGSGTGADESPFSGRLALADGIGRVELTLGSVVCRVERGRAFWLGRENDVTLNLQSGADSRFEGGPGYAGISLGEGTSLSIACPDSRGSSRNPDGTLTASGKDGGAGIGRDSGGSRDRDSQIVIKGGTVNATGEGGGAGIGAGKRGGIGPVTILGGTVSATGGQGGGAGIGGALGAPVGNISIRGGKITAVAASHAAAIGAGVHGTCGSILISGTARIVKAMGGDPGADIGACLFGSCGQVHISGGADIGGAKLWTRTGVPLQMGGEAVTLPQFRLSAKSLGLNKLSVATPEQAQAAQRTVEADRRWVAQIQSSYASLYDRLEQERTGNSRLRAAIQGPIRDSLAATTLLLRTQQSIPLPDSQAIRTHGRRGTDDLRQLFK